MVIYTSVQVVMGFPIDETKYSSPLYHHYAKGYSSSVRLGSTVDVRRCINTVLLQSRIVMPGAIRPESVETPKSHSRLSRDQMFEILSNQRRRSVIHYLKQRGDPVELRELSAQLAAWETGKSIDQLEGNERKRIYTSLQQFHLPKMHTNDIIEFDDKQGVVELTAAADSLDVYLDIVGKNDIPWSKYYTGLSALSAALTIGVWFEIYPLTILPDVSWVAFMATVFTISSLAHVYENRQTRLGTEGPPPDLKEQ